MHVPQRGNEQAGIVPADPARALEILRGAVGGILPEEPVDHGGDPVDGIVDLRTRAVVRPLPYAGPMTFGRGLEVTVTCDESAFVGSSSFLLGSVLSRFFAKYASINSFTETVLRSQQRGEVMRWPISAGHRPTL